MFVKLILHFVLWMLFTDLQNASKFWLNAVVALIAVKTVETRAALAGQVQGTVGMYLVGSTFSKVVPETGEDWIADVST